MHIFSRGSSAPSSDSEADVDFDMLRARLEVNIPRPAVIAISSSTAEDGAVNAARGLAKSLAGAGYSAVFIDASQAMNVKGKIRSDLTLEDIADKAMLSADSGDPILLNVCDLTFQQTTSQRQMHSILELFRTTFDYVIMVAQHGISTPFAASILAAADAVLVAVKIGRRQRALDRDVAETLERLESRFIGVIALPVSVANGDWSPICGSEFGEVLRRRNPSAGVDKDLLIRDFSEIPT